MYQIHIMACIDNNEVNEEENIGDQFSSLLNTLSQFKTQITAMANQIKIIEKNVKKEIKQNKKDNIKRQSKGSRKPSGFAAASPISDELCNFMGKHIGTSIARTEVTKFICSYIKDNSLTDKDNNKIVKPDKKLQALLETEQDTVITYFNIQRFMNKHFLKNNN
jgi:chromatin remodeling complex protein RSC6